MRLCIKSFFLIHKILTRTKICLQLVKDFAFYNNVWLYILSALTSYFRSILYEKPHNIWPKKLKRQQVSVSQQLPNPTTEEYLG